VRGEENEDEDTDDNDDKTVDMSLEDGLATQPEVDNSKCAIAHVGDSATDSMKSEESSHVANETAIDVV
jgi:hypothetical protein